MPSLHDFEAFDPMTPRLSKAAVWTLFVALVGWGCAASLRTDNFKGVCGPEHTRCKASCDELKAWEAADTCASRCDAEARNCEARQRPAPDDAIGTDLTVRPSVNDLQPEVAQSVDFTTGRIDSSGPTVNAQGEVRQAGDVYELMPGGILNVGFTAPADAREAELVITHGAGGGGLPCFVTVSVGDKPLLARYTAPRRGLDGKMKAEHFNMTPLLQPPGEPTGPARPMTVVIYNNAEAGSKAPYFVSRLAFTTRERRR